MKEYGSHLMADLRKWEFAAGYGEIAGMLLAASYMNNNRDRKIQPDPIDMVWPWPDDSKVADVTPEERVQLKKDLLRRSAFRS